MLSFFKTNAERNKQQNSVGWNSKPIKQRFSSLAINNRYNLKDVFAKVDKLAHLWYKGPADASLIRHIPDLSNVSRQEKIFNILPKTA